MPSSDGLTNDERNTPSRPLPSEGSGRIAMMHYRAMHSPERVTPGSLSRVMGNLDRIARGDWTTGEMIALGITPTERLERMDARS